MTSVFSATVKLLLGIVLFIGLPLIGWGAGDLEDFISHPARLGYIGLMFLLQAIVVLRLPAVGQRRPPGTKTISRQRFAVVLLQLLSLGIVLVGPYCDHRQIAILSGYELIRYLGLGLLCAGFIALNWAEASLGRQFSVQVTIQEGHRLVTDGLYRYLRHPRYLGIIVSMLGIALVFCSWWALMLVFALALVLFWRIHDEEALLHEEFGKAWEAYAEKSWRFIPFLY